jgi:hypothetical protein
LAETHRRSQRVPCARANRPSAAASAPTATIAGMGRSDWMPNSTMIDHVGGPNAGSRFTPSTMANRIRYAVIEPDDLPAGWGGA